MKIIGHERKSLRFKTESVDEEQGIFEGYASVFGNVDSGGDIVEPGAFSKFLENGWERVKILALHNDCWLPIGIPLELKEDDRGLYIKGKISDTTMGRDVRTLLKDGVLNEMSIGYDPVTAPVDSEGIRHLKEVDLLEVSLVTWAMNEKAMVTDYKALERDVEGMAAQFTRERKEGRKISASRLKSLEEASATMKKAAKTLDALIKEARAEPPKAYVPTRERKSKNTYEIIWR